MKVIVCLDDDNGMFFNKRRQSQDCAVRDDIAASLQGTRLCMNAYSFKQFKEEVSFIRTEETFLEHAGEGDVCFVENVALRPYEQDITELIIYRWNRKYPADFYFDLDLQKWEMIKSEEFTGNSHEKITKETYIRKGY